MLLNNHKAYNASFSTQVNDNLRRNSCYAKKANASINECMTDTDQKLRELFTEIAATQGLSIRAWSARAGFAEGVLRKFLNGTTKSITVYVADKLLSVVGLSLSKVFDQHRQVQIPIRGEVPQDLELSEQPLGYITWYEVPGENFALTVVGNSMNLCAHPGSQIIVDASQTDKLEQVDKLVVIRHNGRLIFRKLRINPIRFEAMSNDESIEPTVPHSNSDWEIVGRVLYIVREV